MLQSLSHNTILHHLKSSEYIQLDFITTFTPKHPHHNIHNTTSTPQHPQHNIHNKTSTPQHTQHNIHTTTFITQNPRHNIHTTTCTPHHHIIQSSYHLYKPHPELLKFNIFQSSSVNFQRNNTTIILYQLFPTQLSLTFPQITLYVTSKTLKIVSK